jgi:hypothetical protein
VWAANDPQPECDWQERSAAFAGAILMQRSGNRVANQPAIRAQPNAHGSEAPPHPHVFRSSKVLVVVGEGTFHGMVPGCTGDGKEITEQHPSKLKPIQADGLFILYTSCW